jgi:hypothetical protein
VNGSGVLGSSDRSLRSPDLISAKPRTIADAKRDSRDRLASLSGRFDFLYLNNLSYGALSPPLGRR